MVWIGGVVVIGLVASNAGVWGISVVISLVTGIAIKRDMGPCQDIIVVMNGESSWLPVWIRCMTSSTSGWNTQGYVVWICRVVIIGLVTTHAGIGSVVIDAARMAAETINSCMRPGKWVIIIVYREKCRCPSRVGGMAVDTGRRDIEGNVIRVGGIVVIGLVATHASVWRVVVVPARVTAVAVNSCMCPGQGVIVIVYREQSRLPSGVCGMAVDTGRRDVERDVIRVGSIVVIGLVTTHTSVWRIVVVPSRVTAVAVNGGMRPGQRVIVVVDRE